jgi:hypothetical protein
VRASGEDAAPAAAADDDDDEEEEEVSFVGAIPREPEALGKTM